MKIAIVGASKLTEDEELDVKQVCEYILQPQTASPITTLVISGGAEGVDTIAIKTAKRLRLKTKEYLPLENRWKYYMQRNIQIALECDILYCIAVPVHDVKCYHHKVPECHQKTAGCYTMRRALQMQKKCTLIITTDKIG